LYLNYNVFGGTLNLAQSISLNITVALWQHSVLSILFTFVRSIFCVTEVVLDALTQGQLI